MPCFALHSVVAHLQEAPRALPALGDADAEGRADDDDDGFIVDDQVAILLRVSFEISSTVF